MLAKHGHGLSCYLELSGNRKTAERPVYLPPSVGGRQHWK